MSSLNNWLVQTVFCFLSIAVPSADAVANPSWDQLVGEWDVRIDGGGEIYSARLDFDANDAGAETSLVGNYEADGRKGRIDSVYWDDGSYFVEVATRRGGIPVSVTFAFELDGDRLVGDVDFDSGTRSRSYEFEALRVKTSKLDPRSNESESLPKAKMPQTESTASADPPTNQASQVEPSRRRRLQFQNGAAGYESAVDTEIWAIAPSKPLDRQGTMTTDGNNGGGESQVLMRFDGVLGDGEGQVPLKSRIISAKLTVVAFDPGSTIYLHRVLVPWNAAATWDSMAAGMTVDNVEVSTVRDGFSFGEINMDKQSVEFDVTATVQKWADGEENFGWVFVSTGGNGWDFYSSDWIEQDLRPALQIESEPRLPKSPANTSRRISNLRTVGQRP